ncbi:GNAT family acetyltransferase [Microvirga makkahensis]|uniref:GNAT family acetyltransferase n=1 Tax=Microvirga makkahensis TaxID=1128670 RepID=A0A7X3MR61_9HYPH|nr:GNAT family acetyltransferase [Microvirga makkahensis]MXQ11739.1 GNAT family acetyltransferase [Microvirga makkahensis]
MHVLSRLMFAIAGLVLMLLALGLILFGCWRLVEALITPGASLEEPLLGTVGYVVIAVAVFDVAKFLVEEEVLNGRERRIASEARRSLTKFISTIAIAIFLEALVTVFRVSAGNVSQLLYPTFLLVAATLLIVGLGLYQRLSATVERQVDAHDRSAEHKP